MARSLRSTADKFSDGSSPWAFGTLVWTKLNGYPHWPSKVADPALVTREVLASNKRSKSVLVYFFGSRDYAWVDSDQIEGFDEGYKEYTEKVKTKTFAAALKEAMAYKNRLNPLSARWVRKNKLKKDEAADSTSKVTQNELNKTAEPQERASVMETSESDDSDDEEEPQKPLSKRFVRKRKLSSSTNTPASSAPPSPPLPLLPPASPVSEPVMPEPQEESKPSLVSPKQEQTSMEWSSCSSSVDSISVAAVRNEKLLTEVAVTSTVTIKPNTSVDRLVTVTNNTTIVVDTSADSPSTGSTCTKMDPSTPPTTMVFSCNNTSTTVTPEVSMKDESYDCAPKAMVGIKMEEDAESSEDQDDPSIMVAAAGLMALVEEMTPKAKSRSVSRATPPSTPSSHSSHSSSSHRRKAPIPDDDDDEYVDSSVPKRSRVVGTTRFRRLRSAYQDYPSAPVTRSKDTSPRRPSLSSPATSPSSSGESPEDHYPRYYKYAHRHDKKAVESLRTREVSVGHLFLT